MRAVSAADIQNILIVGGAAQVCDFGLARVLGDAHAAEHLDALREQVD